MNLAKRITFAFVGVAAIFAVAGTVCIIELRAVKSHSDEFVERLWPAADALMETRIVVADVSRTVLDPPAGQASAATIGRCREQIDAMAAEVRTSALPPARISEITELLASISRGVEEPVALHAVPGRDMETADAVAEPLIDKLRERGLTGALATAWTCVMAFNDFLITGDAAEERAFATGIAALGRDPELADFRSAIGELGRAGNAVFASSRALRDAQAVYTRDRAALDDLLSRVETEFEADSVDPTAALVTRGLDAASWLLIGSIALATVCAIVLGLLLTRWIVSRLTQAAASLDTGSHQVTVASQQISLGSQDLAGGASEQAASLQESSAALAEISARSEDNARRAADTHGHVTHLLGSVDGTTAAMRELTETMDAVRGASTEVAGIVKTIEEIAFQTNLLALNAAVEAARAGDSGKGFAVVAAEVRALAHRSAEAAGNTVKLIDTNLLQARRGGEVVEKASRAIAEIRAAAEPVARNIEIIDQQTREQAESIGQVTQAIGSIGQTTQQVAATAEEAAASSEELSAQAEEMRAVVNDIVRIVQGGAVTVG